MLTDAQVVRLFARMRHLWGHRFSSHYGEAVDDAGNLTPSARHWQHDLADYTAEQVAAGMAQAVTRRLQWPPGPVELMSLCDGLPMLAQILDRGNDYGPVCTAIRRGIDWYTLEALPAAEMRRAAEFAAERAVQGLRSSGQLAQLSQQQAALSVPCTTTAGALA
jgi:hypothetical protein